MNEGELRQLLRETAALVPTRDPAELAGAVRASVARRRRVRRTVAGSLAAVVVLAASAAVVLHRGPPASVARTAVEERPEPAPTAAELEAEQQSLRAAIALQEAGVDRLLAAERRDGPAPALLFPRETTAQDAAERAAAIVMEWADRLRAEPDRQVEARAAYAELIEKFPRTLVASEAKSRLAQLTKDGPL